MLEYDLVTIAGQNDTICMPVYLLPIDEPSGLLVDETHGGTLTLPEVPGFALTIVPGSATFPDGSTRGRVSVTVVHADKVPMVPNFGQQPRFIITIQPPGTHFNPPAAMTLPNVDGLAPGQKTEMYSFDHDLGSFVSIGPGTVSEDGTVVQSDPGVGVIKGGWHCGGNPATTGGAEDISVKIERTSLSQLVATSSPQPSGDPAYKWKSDPIEGTGTKGPTVDYAPGSTSQTHPNEAQLTAPPNTAPRGGPQPGGLSRITVTYMCESEMTATDDIKAATFGESCYITADEKDFIDTTGKCTCIFIDPKETCGTTIDPPNLTGC